MVSASSYLFVHVPKTAGTSFRLAAEQLLGRSSIAYDYSPQVPETHDAVRLHFYENDRNLRELARALDEEGVALLGGHFNYRRYAKIYPPSRVITFVREPIARIVSEHQHSCRLHGFTGTLLEFAAIPRNQNMQSQMLRGVPLEAAALVGVTELYGDALRLLEARVGWRLPRLVENVNPRRAVVGGAYELTPDEERQLKEWNVEDIAFYGEAVAKFSEQLTPS